MTATTRDDREAAARLLWGAGWYVNHMMELARAVERAKGKR